LYLAAVPFFSDPLCVPLPESHFTSAAGVSYVTYRLSLLGFLPAPVRCLGRNFDLLASNRDGTRAVALHVRTSPNARKSEAGDSLALQFPLSPRIVDSAADTAIFCFVDLRLTQAPEIPDVYIVPAKHVKEEYAGVYIRRYSYFRHHRSPAAMECFRNNWRPLLEALSPSDSNPPTHSDAHHVWSHPELEPADTF
jgi:hypothetical protein